MWAQESPGRLADIARKTKRYPTDVTDEEWERIQPLLLKAPKRGRKGSVDLREMRMRSATLQRRWLAHAAATNLGPWQTVYWWFRRFVRRMLFQTIHDVLSMLDRERAGREASPSGGVLDSQTVKAPHAQVRGFDANRKIVGRKRHIACDTDGRLLMVNLRAPRRLAGSWLPKLARPDVPRGGAPFRVAPPLPRTATSR